MEKENDTFGKVIKTARNQRGLTLRETAKRIGVSHPYLSQLENEHNNNPSMQIIYNISEVLDIPFAYLLSLTDDDLGIKKNIPQLFIDALKHYDRKTLSDLAEYEYKDFVEWAKKDEGFSENAFMIDDLYEYVKNLSQIEKSARRLANLKISGDNAKEELMSLSGGSITLEFALMTDIPITVGNKELTEKEKMKLVKIAEIIFSEEQEE